MKVYEFTDEELLNAVLDEVIAHPGFKYFGNEVESPTSPGEQCRYINDDNEGECIIGCALVKLGVDPEDLVQQEGNGVYAAVFNLREQNDQPIKERYTRILSFLNDIQCNQDYNYSWAESLEQSKKAYAFEPKILELVSARGL